MLMPKLIRKKLEILDVDGEKIEYCRLGSGMPLILVIGYAATVQGWDRRFLNELSKSFEVIVYNNRNTGNSVSKSKNYFIADLANDIEALRKGLELDKIILCGISMGGIIAQQYARQFPENISNLILINTFPPGNLIKKPHMSVEKVLRGLSRGNLINLSRMLKLLFASLWQISLLWLYQFKVNGANNKVAQNAIAEQQAAIEAWSKEVYPEKILNEIKVSALILCGKADQLVPPDNSNLVNQYIKSSKLVEFKNGGHIMIFQYPVAIAQEMTKFIFNSHK